MNRSERCGLSPIAGKEFAPRCCSSCGRWKKSRRSNRPVAQAPFSRWRQIKKRATQAALRSAVGASGQFDLMTILDVKRRGGCVERFLIRRCAEAL
jgi:hypothetical protein